jgi:monofunctional biosynthetic peptidoglycan transglycosylase
MVVVAPESTTFQRSEWQQWKDGAERPWQQRWVDYAQISDHLKRAVMPRKTTGSWNTAAWLGRHRGPWSAMPRKNTARRASRPPGLRAKFGGSITQQLAKNLLLSGERNMLRKGQELVLAHLLELLLSKQRILEIYLNSVEWGNGIFGAEAAARHYFGKSAAGLTPAEAARLAVMLPNPRASRPARARPT